MVEITDVLKKSRAAKAGVKVGDILISVNGKEINDVLDYRFYLAEKEMYDEKMQYYQLSSKRE